MQAHKPAKNAAISRASSSAPRLVRSGRLSASASIGARCIDVRPIHGEVFPHRQNYWRKRRCQLARRRIPVVQARFGTAVVVIEIIPHRGCDRLRYPVDRHRGQQEVTGDALIDITSRIGPGAPLFQIQAASPAGESFSAYPSVWGFVDWIAL